MQYGSDRENKKFQIQKFDQWKFEWTPLKKSFLTIIVSLIFPFKFPTLSSWRCKLKIWKCNFLPTKVANIDRLIIYNAIKVDNWPFILWRAINTVYNNIRSTVCPHIKWPWNAVTVILGQKKMVGREVIDRRELGIKEKTKISQKKIERSSRQWNMTVNWRSVSRLKSILWSHLWRLRWRLSGYASYNNDDTVVDTVTRPAHLQIPQLTSLI